MQKERIFRKATVDDMDAIWSIMLQAKRQMKSLGSNQWGDDYPLPQHIDNDIASGCGYVLTIEGEIAGYAVVDFNSEPAYDDIDGKWISADNNYVVIHRIAVADKFKRQGCALSFFDFAGQLACQHGCSSFRVDTNFDNTYMLAIFKRLGFVLCGKVSYIRGERLAYEKVF